MLLKIFDKLKFKKKSIHLIKLLKQFKLVYRVYSNLHNFELIFIGSNYN